MTGNWTSGEGPPGALNIEDCHNIVHAAIKHTAGAVYHVSVFFMYCMFIVKCTHSIVQCKHK